MPLIKASQTLVLPVQTGMVMMMMNLRDMTQSPKNQPRLRSYTTFIHWKGIETYVDTPYDHHHFICDHVQASALSITLIPTGDMWQTSLQRPFLFLFFFSS